MVSLSALFFCFAVAFADADGAVVGGCFFVVKASL